MAGRLVGKKALVTGAGTGIGREVGLEFAREGADVVLHYSSSAAGAESAAAEARGLGVRAEAMGADLGLVDDCYRLVDAAVGALGAIDILVNNAGVTLTRPFLETKPEQFDRIYNINIRGQWLCAQRAVQHMGAAGGAIVNITSVHAIAGMAGHSVYAGTKGAIVAWTRELAIELAPGVRVNAIAPGWIDVPRQYATPGYDPDRARRMVPAGHVGMPLDVAKGCVYLASDEAAYVTGHLLVIDGGTTAWMSLAAMRSAG
jgi:glucose 1-dehydrogenase